MSQNKINIALLLGDPSGIGPEFTNTATYLLLKHQNPRYTRIGGLLHGFVVSFHSTMELMQWVRDSQRELMELMSDRKSMTIEFS